MLSFDKILSRLKYIEDVNTDLQLSDKIGVNAATISMWRKRKSIPNSFLVDYCLFRNISIDWLLTGKTSEQSLESALNKISEPPATYSDPRDKIIQRLTEENRRLKEALDAIQSITNKSQNK
jgi:hypothetical protein